MRSKEEVINDALHDYNSQIKTWLKTRLYGAWDNGYHHGKDDALKEFLNAPPVTNADKVRSMADEELAEWLYNVCCIEEPFECPALNQPTKNIDCRKVWLDWLKTTAKK